VAKNGTISDLLVAFQKKAGLDDETMQNVRVFEAYNGKFYKELNSNYSVAGVTDYVSLYVERIPEDEVNMPESEFRVSAFNFDKEPSKAHGVPFKFVVKPVSQTSLGIS
jgi:ubiquitin carboxyl-terminal hydrolase 7